MSIKSQFIEQDNNSSNKDNYTIIMDYSNKTFNSFKNANINFYNKDNKEKKSEGFNKNFNKNNYKNNNKSYSYNASLGLNGNNKTDGNLPKSILTQDSNHIKPNIKTKVYELNSGLNEYKNEPISKNYNTLQFNYKQMSKELEELRDESSYLKYKLEELTQKHNNLSNNKSLNSTISFNKTTFINAKKVDNISCIKPYNYHYEKNGSINPNYDKSIGNKTINISSSIKNPKTKGKRELKLKEVKTIWKDKVPLLTPYFDNSKNKKIGINLKKNKSFGINLSMNKSNADNNSVKAQNKKYIVTKNKLKLKNKLLKKSLTQNQFFYENIDNENISEDLVNELNQKNKVIKKLNNSLFEQNKIAENRILLLIKDKNIINEKLYLMQKEKEEYKNKKEKEIKKYIHDLNSNKRIIKELYHEKNILLKSKRESELLTQKLKNIIMEKRQEYENFQNKKNSFSNETNNNSFMKNLKTKYDDINKENQEIKNQILSLNKKLESNQRKEKEIDTLVKKNYKLLLLKSSQNDIKKEEKINENDKVNNNNSSLNSKHEMQESINYEINDYNENENENKNISNNINENIEKANIENTKKYKSENININNKDIELFNKYMNMIFENKNNQIKLSKLQKEINLKNEIITKLEDKIKEHLKNEESMINKIQKEKEDLKHLLDEETQKSLKLKEYAEDQQKKHIKYKSKLEQFKKMSKSTNQINKVNENENENESNKNLKNDYYEYKAGTYIEDGKNTFKLREDIYQLKQQLEEEKNKIEVLRILSENEKEKNENFKNKYNITKKLNLDLINKLKERKVNINKEIQDENISLKKQMIEKDNKTEELKFEIKRLNNEIELYRKELFKNSNNELKKLKNNFSAKNINSTKDNNLHLISQVNPINQRFSVDVSPCKRQKDEKISKFRNLKTDKAQSKIKPKIFDEKKKSFGTVFLKSNHKNNILKSKIQVKGSLDKKTSDKLIQYIQNDSQKTRKLIMGSSDKVIKIFNGIEQSSNSECNSDIEIPIIRKSFNNKIKEFKEIKDEAMPIKKIKKVKTSSLSLEKNHYIENNINKIDIKSQ